MVQLWPVSFGSKVNKKSINLVIVVEELDYSGKDVDLKERDDSNDYDPDDFKMEDGEEKRIIEKQSLRHPSVDQLKKVNQILK